MSSRLTALRGHPIVSKMEIINISGLKTYTIYPHTETTHAKNAVILVHGYGANGRDLIGLGTEWAPQCPSTLFLSPDAPHICEATPLGKQWFSLENFTIEGMEKQIATAWKVLSDYIDAVISDYNIPEKNILLCGFSQGTMMSLYTALHRKNNCAGVLGYSGILLGTQSLDPPQKKKDLPIHLIHGSADPVVPVQAWDDAMTYLKDSGFEKLTGFKTKGLGHNIDITGVESGQYFIKDQFYRE
jgi:phospholipase/carboxylesterase